MITFSQVGRGRNGREGRMRERNQGREKEEGWGDCQGRSRTGQQFQGHLQGSKDDSDCAMKCFSYAAAFQNPGAFACFTPC